MNAIKELAEVFIEHLANINQGYGAACARVKEAEFLTERLRGIIAAESAAEGVKEFDLRCKLRDSEKRCALQLETIRELRAQLAARDLMTATPEAFGEAAVQGADAHKRYEEELEALFATHRREVAKLKLESDRRARSVAEAVIERVTQIGITERKAIEDINIEAIVDGSK